MAPSSHDSSSTMRVLTQGVHDPLNGAPADGPPSMIALRRDAPLKVLVVTTDPEVVRVLRSICPAGHDVREVQSAQAMLDLLDPDDELPPMIVVDWSLPDLPGPELCRLLRHRPAGLGAYVILLSTRGRGENLLDGLAAGADDFLARPFEPEEMLARLRIGERVLGRPVPRLPPLIAVLQEASQSSGGEVVVRQGEEVGRIFLHEGRVAWVHVSSEPGSLLALFDDGEGHPGQEVGSRPAASPDDVHQVVEECRRSGRNFAEVLVERGFIDRDELKWRLRKFLARKLHLLFRLPSPSVLFVPSMRSYSSDLTFALDELLPSGLSGPPLPDSSGLLGEVEPATLDALGDQHATGEHAVVDGPDLSELLTLDGLVSGLLVDVATERIVSVIGQALDPELLWSKIRYLATLRGGGEVESVLVSTPAEHHIVANVPSRPGHYLIVVLQRPATAGATARAVIGAIARQL